MVKQLIFFQSLLAPIISIAIEMNLFEVMLEDDGKPKQVHVLAGKTNSDPDFLGEQLY